MLQGGGDEYRVIVGYQEYSWLIVTPKTVIHTQTIQEIELVLEELYFPSLGWY